MVKTQPAKYILRKHNLEMYLTKSIEPEVPFIGLLPMADNDTGEFATVLSDPTAAEDTANSVMSEPLDTAEASELTEIDISPLNAVLGRTMAVGYEFKYTKQFLKRQDSDARVQLALSKIKAGMIQKINGIILQGIVNGAGAAFPNNLSTWASAIDPRADAIKLRTAFNSGASGTDPLPFELDTCFISGAKHVNLQEYYMSMDWPFNNKEIDVDGTKFINVKNSFAQLTSAKDLVGIDSRIPPGIIEKYVDPDYSVIRQAELADPQKSLTLPQSLINVNMVEPRKYNESYIVQVVAELGYSNQEAKGAVAGTL